MTTKIDWAKPIETTDGRPAKVVPYEVSGNDAIRSAVHYREVIEEET